MMIDTFVYSLCILVGIAYLCIFLFLRGIKVVNEPDNVLELTRKSESQRLRIDLVVYLGVPAGSHSTSPKLAQNMRLFADKLDNGQKQLPGYARVELPSTNTEIIYKIDEWV